MKKLATFVFSVLLALSVPALAAANMHKEGKGACCDGGQSTCMKHDKGGWGMREGRGGFGELGREVRSMMPGFYLRHKDELKLTGEQVASLEKIKSDMRKDFVTKAADVKVKRIDLAETLGRPDYKVEDVTAKLKGLEDSRLALETAMLQHAVQARGVLTPEQLKGAKDIRPHGRGERRHDRMGG